jgi:periplasmic divalent cation tolerance protein
MAATPYSIAFVTVPNEAVGEKIAGGLVSAKLAACVNIIPGVKSIYEWDGKVQKGLEAILKIKTRTSRIQELTEFVKANNPYDVCQVITTAIEGGNPQYLEWVGNIVQEK